ncbi:MULTISPECIES: phenylacetate--CoA ligase family protein [Mycolicibacterium]|uniref:Coenzyme F390 synthetase n=1 Tax=Mycolicibacterium gilvum (strain DSM 45189 / LMG 24558 / Spyr1) TaxID=278137 RepID=E6TKD4_MYCSR|nr:MULTISPECIES: phenylacetate--CoA ligase family protein [Mycolicibacterium]ADU00349.1 coenzyme F390 synthetase [Mycolicibacterium gilvum Spyr1]MBV5242989.1 phenylacetate--CoA ligase family protein [Mycolicibacterium sp. PAM1]
MSRLEYTRAIIDAYRASREGAAGIDRRQQQRLREIVAYARAHSPHYRRLYHDAPESISRIDQLPPVTKAELMSHFDDWVTDPAVAKERVEEFLADPGNIGRDFLGRYVVCTTSGATGEPAILLHDAVALRVYNVLGYARSVPVALLSPRTVWALLRGRARMAAVFVTGGHFLANTMMARRIRKLPWRRRMQRIFSAMTPLAELIADLNAFQPVVLGGYPSALVTLARAQQDGRLCIHPVMISAAGESLPSVTRRLIGAAFGCRVGNYYGSSEAVGLTFECREDRLHVNSDWYIVEPVDEHNRTVPAGQLSEGVLVTNLANRIQPIIRYQLGDRVTVDPEPCPCGSPFPTIDVVGRTDDTLTFTTPDGGQVEILPLAVATVAEETAGVVGCQLIQRAPTALSVRLRVEPPEEQDAVWPVLKDRLAAFLSEHGATAVTIDKDDEPPALNPRSGKYRQVYVDIAETA